MRSKWERRRNLDQGRWQLSIITGPDYWARSAGRQHSQLPYILNGTDAGHRWPLLSIKCRALREESHTAVIKQAEEGEGLRRVAYNLGHSFLTCRAGAAL